MIAEQPERQMCGNLRVLVSVNAKAAQPCCCVLFTLMDLLAVDQFLFQGWSIRVRPLRHNWSLSTADGPADFA